MRFDWRGSRCALVCGALLAAGLLAGCTHPTVVVTRVSSAAGAPTVTEKVDGIPFYAKYGVCQQETVWLEPQYTWSLTVQADDQAPMTLTTRLSGHGYQQAAVQQALGSLQALNGKHEVSAANTSYCPVTAREPWDEVSGNPEYQVQPVADDTAGLTRALPGTLVRVANTAVVQAAVDYSRVYFINARTPFIGTGNIDAKLNADGTLTEGNSQVNDQTWSSVLSALSGAGSFATSLTGMVSTVMGTGAAAESALSSEGGAEAPPPPPPPMPAERHPRAGAQPTGCQPVPGWPDVKKTVTYTFVVTPVVYQHDHTRQVRVDMDGVCAAAKGAGVTEGSFVVSPVVPPAEKSAAPPAPTPAPTPATPPAKPTGGTS